MLFTCSASGEIGNASAHLHCIEREGAPFVGYGALNEGRVGVNRQLDVHERGRSAVAVLDASGDRDLTPCGNG